MLWRVESHEPSRVRGQMIGATSQTIQATRKHAATEAVWQPRAVRDPASHAWLTVFYYLYGLVEDVETEFF